MQVMHAKTLIPFVVWFISAFVLVVVLESYLSGLNQLRFTPRTGFSIDFSSILTTVSSFWIWILAISIISYFAIKLISRSILASRVFLIWVIIAAIGIAILANWVLRQGCEGLDCIVL